MKEGELTTLEDQKRLLERDRIKAERKKLTRVRRDNEISWRLSRGLLDATRKVALREHVFKTDEELISMGLKPHQIAVVRQWEQAKRNASFAIESSSKHVEAQYRSQQEKQSVKINVENATIVLPEKKEETIAPVYIDVQADDK